MVKLPLFIKIILILLITIIWVTADFMILLGDDIVIRFLIRFIAFSVITIISFSNKHKMRWIEFSVMIAYFLLLIVDIVNALIN